MGDPTAQPAAGAAGAGAWAVPDSHPVEAAVPALDASPAAAPGAPARPAGGGAGAPELPVPLRPMTALERIDGGLRILKLAPAVVLVVAAIAVVPVQVVAALVPDDPTHPIEAGWYAWFGRGTVMVFGEESARLVTGVALLSLESIALSFVTAALALLVSGWYAGTRPATAEVLGGAARRLPTLAAAWALVHAVEAALGVLLVLPGALAMAALAVVAPIVATEGVGAVAALRRSWDLTRRHLGPVLGACIAVALADVGVRGAFSGTVIAWTELGLPGEGVAAAVVGIAARLVTVPMVAGATVLLYLDLRARVEGLDLDLAIDELWPDAAA